MQTILGFLSIIVFSLTFLSCNQNPVIQQKDDSDALLRIYFFHLTERCPACTAVESETKAVLDKHFKTRVDSGIIKFSTFNINRKENRAVTEKYQISYTSLLLICADGTITDFTTTSLNYASMNPSKFEELLKAEIIKNIE
jgi:hypothetical protein